MNNTRKLSLNLLGALAFGLLSAGCDSNGQNSKATPSTTNSKNAVSRSVNIKHRAKNPTACEAVLQACMDAYGACSEEGVDSKLCGDNLHDCVFSALGSDACWPEGADKKKKKKKKDNKKKKKKDCDKNKDKDKDKDKDDDCDKDFEDDDTDFEDDDFEDDGLEDNDNEGNDDDFELGDEDDIPDFDECEDMNFFAQLAKNLGLTLKVAACTK